MTAYFAKFVSEVAVTKTGCKGNKNAKLKFARGNEKNYIFVY